MTFALGIDRHQLGVGAGFELARDFERLGIDDIHDVAVAGGHEQLLAVGAHHDAARTPRDLDGLDDLQRVAVQHGDGVVLLVGDEDRRGEGRGGKEKERGSGDCGKEDAVHVSTFGRWVI